MVSGRVVNTSNVTSQVVSNLINAPTERPIQLRCINLRDSGQSISLSPSSNLSAYLVIFNTHWRIGLRIIGKWPRSDTNLLSIVKTSSFANTVFKSSDQLTSTSLISAKSFSNNLAKIH
jgi:hypothetical protein